MRDNEYKEPKKFEKEEPAVTASADEAASVVEPETPVPAAKPAPAKETHDKASVLDEVYRVANCAKVYIRSHPRPGIPSDVVGTLAKGDIVHVDPGFVNDDYKKVVKGDVLVGYVSSGYLEKILSTRSKPTLLRQRFLPRSLLPKIRRPPLSISKASSRL